MTYEVIVLDLLCCNIALTRFDTSSFQYQSSGRLLCGMRRVLLLNSGRPQQNHHRRHCCERWLCQELDIDGHNFSQSHQEELVPRFWKQNSWSHRENLNYSFAYLIRDYFRHNSHDDFVCTVVQYVMLTFACLTFIGSSSMKTCVVLTCTPNAFPASKKNKVSGPFGKNPTYYQPSAVDRLP